MSISFGPFVAGFIAILFLTIYVYMLLNHTKSGVWGGMRWIFVCMSILLVRMIIPVNFPFTITILDRKFLSHIGDIIYREIGGIEVFTIMLVVWIIVCILLLGRFCYRTIVLHKHLSKFITQDENTRKLLERYADQRVGRVKVAIVPYDISPAITGIVHPVLILPESEMDETYIQKIIDHEIMHYLKYDLYLKLLIEVITCVYWWNPIVYLLRSQFFLAIEISNDVSVVKNISKEECLEYANSILIMTKKRNRGTGLETNQALSFGDIKKSHTYIRMNRILYGNYSEKKSKIIINCMFVIVVAVAGIFLVPEGVGSMPKEKDVFDHDPENSYFIKSELGYELYIDSEYMGTIDEIPDDFKDVEIREH